MNESPGSLPSRDDELALHRRLFKGDPTAPSDLAATYLGHLIGWLTSRNRRCDEHSCITAAEDALLSLAKQPQTYDPTRQSLAAYLRMSAQGDLRNALRSEQRHHQNRVAESVEQLTLARNKDGRDDHPARILEIEEETAKAMGHVLPGVCEGLSEPERRVLDLILTGQRKTAVFAEALGISHLPVHDQRADVKRVKDKLKKRIEREASGDAEPS
jgi:RNA polymerase sigma factor (sigma-70 family)